MTKNEILKELNSLFNSFLLCESETEFLKLQKKRKELFIQRCSDVVESLQTSNNKRIVQSMIQNIYNKAVPDTLDFRRLAVLVSILLFIEDIENDTN